VISIGPILRVPGMREALAASAAPVVAVSPIVGGTSVKGPTLGFLRWAGVPASAAGVAAYYGDVLDGMVADEPLDGLAATITDTMMADAEGRRRVAEAALELAGSLRR
jgi:LPPG:FO 2-phospho-L-lactate transferase